MSGALWIGLFLLCSILILELVAPQKLTEGFEGLVPVLSSKPSYFTQFIPKRGDVGPTMEQGGYIKDERYFSGYVDVQRFGVGQDYCRMIVPASQGKSADPKKTFFACALAGTKDVSTVVYKTNTVEQGFLLSRDDYMSDTFKDGRADYCRILQQADNSFQPMCRRALDTGFSERDEIDPDPPEDILKLLSFYDGCAMWLRLRDDLLDYTGNTQLLRAGSIFIDETPRPKVTKGLTFDGVQQFLRIGDAPDLTLGSFVKMRTVRAVSVWVYMEEFTNNAHFFDFGDGPGKNNTFLGILGKGDPQIGGGGELRPLLCATADATIPSAPSGAQEVNEVTAKELMKTTRANVDEYVDIDQEVQPRILGPSMVRIPTPKGGVPNHATLLYEVWDQRQRKMSIKINGCIPLRTWTHIAVTAITGDAMRPDIGVFINGEQVYVNPSGFLPQATTTTNNYLGKSNWANDTSTYELRDELFHGSLFDFRLYNSAMAQSKIKDTIFWGKQMLGL